MSQSSIKPIQLSSRASSTILASYLVIDPDGFDFPVSIVRIVNDSNQAITISYDGVNDHDYLAAASSLQLPFQSNSQPQNFTAIMPKGTRVYVKGTAGTGTIILAGYYQAP